MFSAVHLPKAVFLFWSLSSVMEAFLKYLVILGCHFMFKNEALNIWLEAVLVGQDLSSSGLNCRAIGQELNSLMEVKEGQVSFFRDSTQSSGGAFSEGEAWPPAFWGSGGRGELGDSSSLTHTFSVSPDFSWLSPGSQRCSRSGVQSWFCWTALRIESRGQGGQDTEVWRGSHCSLHFSLPLPPQLSLPARPPSRPQAFPLSFLSRAFSRCCCCSLWSLLCCRSPRRQLDGVVT